MPITVERQLFQYDELDESAKETAKEWWLSCRDETDYECVIEDFQRIGEILGISFKTRPVKLMSGKMRHDPCIWWSLGYCQSDYAAFEGTMSYRKGMAKAIRGYAPKDTTLHDIAKRITALHARTLYRDTYTVSHSDYYGIQVEPSEFDWRDTAGDRADGMKQIAKDLSQWLYKQLVAQDEYLQSDEQIEEAMEANAYTFNEIGKREDP